MFVAVCASRHMLSFNGTQLWCPAYFEEERKLTYICPLSGLYWFLLCAVTPKICFYLASVWFRWSTVTICHLLRAISVDLENCFFYCDVRLPTVVDFIPAHFLRSGIHIWCCSFCIFGWFELILLTICVPPEVCSYGWTFCFVYTHGFHVMIPSCYHALVVVSLYDVCAFVYEPLIKLSFPFLFRLASSS